MRHIRIETRMQGETVWLTQKQLAELFQTSIPNINMHIKNIFEEGELSLDSVIQESLIAAADGKNYRIKSQWRPIFASGLSGRDE